MTNPYNCTKPGNLFVGYSRFIQEIVNGLKHGHSYALIGGRRCGKTSLLMQIEKRLTQGDLAPFSVQAHRFSIQRFDALSVACLFSFIYNQVTVDCPVEPWPEHTDEGAYQIFLNLLEEARPVLMESKGVDWLAVLLVDELDAAITRLPDDVFFQNLRHLLMDSPFQRHFRVVASGATEMASLISSGSSPLNNLRHKYLRILSAKQARELVAAGFGEDYEEAPLFKLTGRHPYLLQGLLEKLWDQGSDRWSKLKVKQAGRDFLREHRDFDHWLYHFGPAEKAVYHLLAAAPDGTLSFAALREQVPSELRPKVEDAITVLSYHGVIDDGDPDEPELVGTLFKNWYLNRTEEDIPSTMSEPQPAPASDTRSSPHVHVEVSPVIHGGTIQQGLGPEDVANLLDLIGGLKQTIQEIQVDDAPKIRAQHALENATVELKAPASGSRPEKGKVKAAIEESAKILKAAGAATEQLTAFIKKAEQLGPWLGVSIGWLSGLF